MASGLSITNSTPDERMLRAMAEQLKIPLLQIARQAELAELTGKTPNFKEIINTADNAMQLIDGYLLSVNHLTQQTLELEPVSVSSVMVDVIHKLQPLAKQNNFDLNMSLSGKYGPVMAHRKSLETALLLLGYSLLSGRDPKGKKGALVFGMHKTANGLTAGLFDEIPGFSSEMLKRGRALYGTARQAVPSLSSDSGVGVFVADALLRSMESPIYVAKHNKLTGLAFKLYPSNQLSLV